MATLMGVLGAARIDGLLWARFIAAWMAWLLGLSALFVIGAVCGGSA